MVMFASVTQIGKASFDFLPDQNFVHEVIPACGFGQLPHEPRRFFFD
jgi:hypothetical protein